MTAASEINKIIVRQLQRHKLEYEIDLDPNQDNQKVVFCDDENLGQQRIFKECSEDELTLLFSALIENKALYWDIALEIAKLLPEKGHLIEDKFSIDDWAANPFYGFNQLLFAALGSDQKYESEIIKSLDAVPEDARDGVFMACEALNTPAICRKLMEKFTLWIKTDPDYGISTGEGGYLEKFIALWQKTQDDKSVDEFITFCRKNWHYAREEKMTENNTILKSGKLALFYALTTGLLAWVAGCVLVFAWVGLTGVPPISAMVRMFIYHHLYFYLYFAIIAVFYSGWLYCYLLNIRQARKRAFWGLIMICTLSVIPCGVLYEVQDMLHGFYPEYSIFTKLFGYLEGWFIVGYFIILTSLPITIPAVFCFFFVNKKVALLFDKGYKPAIYRKLANWHQEHPKSFFITAGTGLWVLFFAAAMWSFEFDRETSVWRNMIYIPRGSFNPWLLLGLPFLIGIGMGLSGLIYLLKFINRKLAWAVLLLTVSILSGWAIWENLPQNCFINALGNAYHKGMRLESLKTFHSFNNSDELIAGKFYSSKEMICDQALKVSPNRQVILKKINENHYKFESRFDSGRRQGRNFEKIEKWTVEK